MIRLAFFFSALSLAAVMDIRTRTIPDWLVVLVALTSVLPPGTPNFLGVLAGLPLLLSLIHISEPAAPCRDYHRRNRRRGCETHGGMRPDTWSEPSAYGTVPCIVSAGAVACGREHGQKKEQKETKRGEGTGIPACSVSFCRNADWYLDRRLKN